MAGEYKGSNRIDVPIRTRSVTADKRASATITSGVGFGDATWPPTQSESIGRCSRAGAVPGIAGHESDLDLVGAPSWQDRHGEYHPLHTARGSCFSLSMNGSKSTVDSWGLPSPSCKKTVLPSQSPPGSGWPKRT